MNSMYVSLGNSLYNWIDMTNVNRKKSRE